VTGWNLARILHLGTVANLRKRQRLSGFTFVVAVVLELVRPVTFHSPRAGQIVVRLNVEGLVLALRLIAVLVEHVVDAADVDALQRDVRAAVLDVDEVFDEVGVLAVRTVALSQLFFGRPCRRKPSFRLIGACRPAARTGWRSGRWRCRSGSCSIESGAKSLPSPRSGVVAVDVGRSSNHGVVADDAGVVTAGVLRIRHVEFVLAVAHRIVGRAEARNEVRVSTPTIPVASTSSS
jgi:hypothetical protein